MYYELYIDIFFLVNFIMDICILAVSKRIIKCPATCGSICAGALLGSFLTCVTVILPIQCGFAKFMIFHGLISILMTKTGLRIRGTQNFCRAYVVVYISTFFIGGIFGSLGQYMREAGVFIVFAAISCFAALGIWHLILYMARYRNYYCEVLLCQGECRVKAKAIIDTGNCLRDRVTGKPVNIISKHIARKLWQDSSIENLRYIPYHTIGKKEGLLPMLLLDQMCLYLEGEKWMSNVLVAISEDISSVDECEVILNPDMK